MAHSISIMHERPVAKQTGAGSTTPRFLTCGVVAGPLFVVVALVQVLTVPGFQITRHAISALETGPLGGIQIANFLVSGILLVGYAAGVRRALRGRRGGVWGPVLLGVCGLGFIGGALFHPDPGLGFPVGTPDVIPTTISTHALLHMLFGSLAFFALIAACFVLARPFAANHQRNQALILRAAGVIFAVGLVESFTGGPLGSLVLYVTASIALVAIALAARWLQSSTSVAPGAV
ncbi:MAG: DUF998 domain-containing protein [Chloroflexi bacterium]|nr:DUF998 domain-containing protein [Chloroflexota bacterium]MBV9895655.1 DUF998 domain-containing protein [Chloroflexota bacterium]